MIRICIAVILTGVSILCAVECGDGIIQYSLRVADKIDFDKTTKLPAANIHLVRAGVYGGLLLSANLGDKYGRMTISLVDETDGKDTGRIVAGTETIVGGYVFVSGLQIVGVDMGMHCFSITNPTVFIQSLTKECKEGDRLHVIEAVKNVDMHPLTPPPAADGR